jgi:hypothetical protein
VVGAGLKTLPFEVVVVGLLQLLWRTSCRKHSLVFNKIIMAEQTPHHMFVICERDDEISPYYVEPIQVGLMVCGQYLRVI